jgi:hypothetical protein
MLEREAKPASIRDNRTEATSVLMRRDELIT